MAILAVLPDGSQLPLHVILNCKIMPKEQLPSEVIVKCQPKCWMANEFMKDWLLVEWNRRPQGTGLGHTQGTFKTRKKSHDYWQFHKHRPCGGNWRDDLTNAGVKYCGEQTVQKPPNAAVL